MAHLKTAATTGNLAERAKWKWSIIQRIYEKGWANKEVVKVYNIADTMMALPRLAQTEFSTKVKRLEEDRQMPLISPTIELALEEGEFKGKQELIIKQLKRRVGELHSSLIKQVKALDIEELEELGEVLLDFSTITDLEQWLESRPKPVEQE